MSTRIDETSTVTLHIIAKAVGAELKKRDRLPVGDYVAMDRVSMDIEGTVDVSEDEDYIPTTNIPMKATLALFMRYAGVTGPAAMKALTRAMTEAAEMERSGSKERLKAITELADLDAAMDKVLGGLEAMPKATRKGKVRVKGQVF